MRFLAIILLGISVTSSGLFVSDAYAYVSVTPFDLDITSDDFYKAAPNYHPYLIMKRGDSQQITVHVTNNDTVPHAINLFMAKETPRPDRTFVFEPSHLQIEPGNAATSTLTVSASPDADTGLTVLHTLIAQSTSFGAKSFAFYVQVSDKITPPSPDIIRHGPDGEMFSKDAQFDLSEGKAFEIIPYDVSTPIVPDDYSFQVMSGSDEEPRLFYAKEQLSENTLYSEFLDGETLSIMFEKEEHFTYDEYLRFLNHNEQQVMINGKNGIAASAEVRTEDGSAYAESRVTVFLDDVKLRLESKMPDEQLLQIAESMIREKSIPAKALCEDENTILQDGICQKIAADPQPSDFRESGGNIGLLYAYSGLGLAGIVVGFLIVKKWRKRK